MGGELRQHSPSQYVVEGVLASDCARVGLEQHKEKIFRKDRGTDVLHSWFLPVRVDRAVVTCPPSHGSIRMKYAVR